MDEKALNPALIPRLGSNHILPIGAWPCAKSNWDESLIFCDIIHLPHSSFYLSILCSRHGWSIISMSFRGLLGLLSRQKAKEAAAERAEDRVGIIGTSPECIQ